MTQDSIRRSLEEMRLSVSDIERAFAEETVSEEIQRAVSEGMKKAYRSQRRFDAMRSRAFTLDAVDSEVAKYRQRPHLDLIQAVSCSSFPIVPRTVMAVSVLKVLVRV